jgi:hypothetical protein
MHTAHYGVLAEPLGQPLVLGMREGAARLFAVETYEHANRGRMNTRPVTLVENGFTIDRFDGAWMSGYCAQDN